MNICYGDLILPQISMPCTYFLAYLPTFSAQNYQPSTFIPSTLPQTQIPIFLHQNLSDSWQSNPPALQHDSIGLSLPKKAEGGAKGGVIQKISEGRKEEEGVGKTIQKQSRNVLSNLLRILFKNVLEVRMYDDLITRIITLQNFPTTLQEFYRWLEGYGVNYKNYIRFCVVKRIMVSKKRKDHLAIFRAILMQYIKVEAIAHCLTSKRIDRASMEMHLQGLRQLKKDLLSK